MTKKEMEAIVVGMKLKRIAERGCGIRITIAEEGEPFYIKEDGSRTTVEEEADLFFDTALINEAIGVATGWAEREGMKLETIFYLQKKKTRIRGKK